MKKLALLLSIGALLAFGVAQIMSGGMMSGGLMSGGLMSGGM